MRTNGKRTYFYCLALGALTALASMTLVQRMEAQDKEEPKPVEKREEPAKEKEAPVEARKEPEIQIGMKGANKETQFFDQWQGYWNADFKVWNYGAEKPIEFKSPTHRLYEKDGFFLKETRIEKAVEVGGNGEQTHVYGYDAFKQEYFAFLYGAGVGTPFYYRGKWDKDKNALVLTGGFQIVNDGKLQVDAHERMEIAPIKDGVQKVLVYAWGKMGETDIPEHLHLDITYTRDELEPMGPKYIERYTSDAKAGKGHERLAKMLGKWDTTITVTPDGMEPMAMNGVTTFTAKMEGRFFDEAFEGDEEAKKSPFYVPHVTMHGFDNAAERYQMTSYRAGGFNSDIWLFNGKYDAKLKASAMFTEYWDPINDRWVGVKYVHYDPTSKDGVETMRVEAFFDFLGTKAWSPAWNVTYTRKVE